MTTKRIIGLAILATLVAAMFAMIAMAVGFWTALAIFAGSAAVGPLAATAVKWTIEGR